MKDFLEKLIAWRDAVRAARDAAGEARDKAGEARDAITAKVAAEKRNDLSAEETSEFRRFNDEHASHDAEFVRLAKECQECDERITDLTLQVSAEERAGSVALFVGAPAQVTREALTYERHDKTTSYFRDLGLALVNGDSEADERLKRHAQEMDKIIPERERRREEKAERDLEAYDAHSSFEKRVNPNRTDGQGGYFVPPLWLVDDYAAFLRAGRPFANSVRNIDLPAGTDSINVPTIATGTATAAQTADGAAVQSTDLTDSYVTAPVRTMAGQQDVALQLLEQSPVAFDDIVFQDLIADYNKKIDAQLWTGSGSSGQVTGVDNVASTNTVTYTDASPTVPEFWAPLAQAASKLAQNRFDFASTRFFFHPRRWFWMLGALDTTNRPLIVPSSVGANPMASPELAAQGHVGVLSLGLPASIDANISTSQTDGSSGEDRAYAINTNDLILFEGSLRSRALPEVLSGTLQVRLQVYAYFAFLVRYAKAICWIAGTGQAAPSGY